MSLKTRDPGLRRDDGEMIGQRFPNALLSIYID